MSKKTFYYIALLALLLGLAVVGCKKRPPVAQAPPPPPPPAAAPPPAPAAPTIELEAVPSTIQRGESATLSWRATNAESVTIEPEIGRVGTSGSRQVAPESSTTYTARAQGAGGEAVATARITVTEPPAPAPAPTIEELFSANVQDIFFDFDRYNIRPDQQEVLRRNAEFLRQHPDVRFIVEGHCDERGTEEYNLALGDRRANAVKEFLIELGIAANRITTISYGEEGSANFTPVAGHDESAWSQNRRAHFVLSRN